MNDDAADKDKTEKEPTPSYTTEELISKITPENVRSEIKTGPPRGKEVW